MGPADTQQTPSTNVGIGLADTQQTPSTKLGIGPAGTQQTPTTKLGMGPADTTTDLPKFCTSALASCLWRLPWLPLPTNGVDNPVFKWWTKLHYDPWLLVLCCRNMPKVIKQEVQGDNSWSQLENWRCAEFYFDAILQSIQMPLLIWICQTCSLRTWM